MIKPTQADLDPFKSSTSKSENSNLSDTKSRLIETTTEASSPETSRNQSFLFIDLPHIVNNSTLVRQRASAQEVLAVASVNTAVPLPLIIGGRSKCVLNIVEDTLSSGNKLPCEFGQISGKVAQCSQQFDCNQASPNRARQSTVKPATKSSQMHQCSSRVKNNMVSVVRPVVSTPIISNQASSNYKEDSKELSSLSLVDEMMNIELNKRATFTDAHKFELNSPPLSQNSRLCLADNDFQTKQQLAYSRREEFELSKGVQKQHSFVISKLEERKRDLLIVQSVWAQRDFKRAIETMVDIYYQGLSFTYSDGAGKVKQPHNQAGLTSLKTSLVTDVLSVITLRPKLWNLEICQLLLPIIINDLLLAQTRSGSGTNQISLVASVENTLKIQECYIDLALKTLHLIVSQFGALIKNTIDSQKESSRLVTGVDLSREERVNRCSNCYQLLREARKAVASIKLPNRRSRIKELEQLLASMLDNDEANQAKSRRQS